jgi:hypothetical protein
MYLERGPLSLVSTTEELLGTKSSGSGLEDRGYGCRDTSRWPRDTLYPQKSALTSPTSGGSSVSTSLADNNYVKTMHDLQLSQWIHVIKSSRTITRVNNELKLNFHTLSPFRSSSSMLRVWEKFTKPVSEYEYVTGSCSGFSHLQIALITKTLNAQNIQIYQYIAETFRTRHRVGKCKKLLT